MRRDKSWTERDDFVGMFSLQFVVGLIEIIDNQSNIAHNKTRTSPTAEWQWDLFFLAVVHEVMNQCDLVIVRGNALPIISSKRRER